MESDAAASAGIRPAGPVGAAATLLLELALVTLVFAAAGAWPTPDTNEAHYLTRARHLGDPAWLAGDFFLESSEAHGVFSRLLGPLAVALPLESAAWIGRWAGWICLAGGFVSVARAAALPAVARIAAAALFSLAVRHTTAAGEWVIGGCEAKVFSWALVLAGVGWFARGKASAAFVAMGAATAVHPLVGGWAMIALCVPVLAGRVLERSPTDSPGGAISLPALAAGLALAAAGVVPALWLSADAEPAERARAAAIYVTERLPHHLLVRTFADGMVARHLLAIGMWWILAPAAPGPGARRVAAFTAAAVGVSVAGLGVSMVEAVAPSVAYSLLRYYWFRLADGIVPLGLAIAVAGAIAAARGPGSAAVLRPARRWWAAVAVLAATLATDLRFESLHWPLPGRSVPPSRADKGVQAAAWVEICAWIRDNTPSDACFLTPRGASSFHWRAERREVVCWKNVPQDPASILEWRRRIVDCFSVDGSLKSLVSSTAALGADRLLEVARTHGADHIVVPVNPLEPFPLGGPPLHVAGGYAVHRIDPESDAP